MLIMGGAGVIAAVLVMLFLPETLNQKLPETMDEALALGKRKCSSDSPVTTPDIVHS